MDEFWNPFSYCGGNPIRFIDPFGLDIWEATGGEFQMMDEMSAAGFDWSVYADKKGDYTISQIFSGGFQDFLGQQALNNFINTTIYTNPDFGISMMKDVTGYVNNVAWLIPPAKVPAQLLNYSFMAADWAMKYHQTGQMPVSTMLIDAASIGLGAASKFNAKATLGTFGEEIISNAVSRGFSETSSTIMNASKKR